MCTEVAAMNVSRSSLCAVADKDTLYAIGGRSNIQTLDVVERFDPKMNSWCRVASTLEKREYSFGVILKSRVFLFGGFTSREFVDLSSSIEMYDPVSNIWTAIQNSSAPACCSSVTSLNGRVYVTGFQSHNHFLWIYDPDKNEWKHCTRLPISAPISLASLRIPRDILNMCKVVT